MALNTVAPAFGIGCTLVLKPCPFTPTIRRRQILRAEVPARVFGVVSGGDELGQWMTDSPDPPEHFVYRLGGHGQEGERLGGRRLEAGAL
jgi:acyl-CoA reductase-like NAD-dependent aldehyde dehydrogenase